MKTILQYIDKKPSDLVAVQVRIDRKLYSDLKETMQKKGIRVTEFFEASARKFIDEVKQKKT